MSRTKLRGFTLIELMIAVAIVGIIVAIALPSYNSYIQRTRGAVAGACLMEHAHFMERYRTTNLTYVGADLSTFNTSCKTDLATSYSFEFANTPTAGTFEISAVPVSTGPQASYTKCGTLGITHSGQKKSSGTGTVAECWR